MSRSTLKHAQWIAIGILMSLPTVDALAFGPYPPGTTVFVDDSNNTGVEFGTPAEPFNTMTKGLAAAAPGDVVGVAPGDYEGEPTLNIVQPVELVGFHMATTRVHAVEFKHLIKVQSANVRIAGLSLLADEELLQDFEPEYDTCYSSISTIADPTIVVEQSVIRGHCTGIGIWEDTGATDGPTLTRLTIADNWFGIYGVADSLTNSVLRNNIWAYQAGSSPTIEEISVVNNTVINNGVDIFTPNTGGLIKNNIFVDNEGSRAVDAGYPRAKLPALVGNIFHGYDKGEEYDYVLYQYLEGQPDWYYTSAAQLNALSGSSGNVDGDPQLLSDTYPLPIGGSIAIDAGVPGGSAPFDHVGNPRPVDGNGDCETQWDVGGYEVAAPYSSDLWHLGRCIEWVLVTEDKWLSGGCAIIDYCPFCPGREILDWEIYAEGAPLEWAVLHIEGLAEGAADRIQIESEARWLSDNQLLVPAGQQIILRGLEFPESGERSTLRMTAETFIANEPMIGSPRAVHLTQFVRGAVIADAAIEY